MKVLLIVASLVAFAQAVPLHASCKIDWTFSTGCTDVMAKIVTQIGMWDASAPCGTGEKCMYTLKSQTSNTIKATHKTPVHHYVDDLTFTFTASGSGCAVHGYSTSETWYAVLDYSTNYCNLNNLITGSALDMTNGYAESTSNSVCTQYSSRNCDKY